MDLCPRMVHLGWGLEQLATSGEVPPPLPRMGNWTFWLSFLCWRFSEKMEFGERERDGAFAEATGHSSQTQSTCLGCLEPQVWYLVSRRRKIQYRVRNVKKVEGTMTLERGKWTRGSQGNGISVLEPTSRRIKWAMTGSGVVEDRRWNPPQTRYTEVKKLLWHIQVGMPMGSVKHRAN